VGRVTTERDAEPKCDTVQHRDGSFHGPSLCVCGDVDTSATAADKGQDHDHDHDHD